jgi:hypothetical protein
VTLIVVLLGLALALMMIGAAARNGDDATTRPMKESETFASNFIR